MALSKEQRRQRIHYRIRKTVAGSAERPRLAVFRSNKEIYAQLIDDVRGVTITAASSRDKDIDASKANKTEAAKLVGKSIAEKAIKAGLTFHPVGITAADTAEWVRTKRNKDKPWRTGLRPKREEELIRKHLDYDLKFK